MRRTILRSIGLAAALFALSPAVLRAQSQYVTGRVVEAGSGAAIRTLRGLGYVLEDDVGQS